jgi:hypothetical protein
VTATHPSEPDPERAPEQGPFRYQPFYCEENAWWLCAEPVLGPGLRHVVFITNRAGLCPFLNQRAAAPGEAIGWDYHCVVLDGRGRIWDLDTRLGLPLPGRDWLAGSMPFAAGLPAALKPMFRLVPATHFRRDFASDRGHMRLPDGRWQHPPPPWPPIGLGMNLADYLSPSSDGPGELFGLSGFVARLDMLAEADPDGAAD